MLVKQGIQHESYNVVVFVEKARVQLKSGSLGHDLSLVTNLKTGLLDHHPFLFTALTQRN